MNFSVNPIKYNEQVEAKLKADLSSLRACCDSSIKNVREEYDNVDKNHEKSTNRKVRVGMLVLPFAVMVLGAAISAPTENYTIIGATAFIVIGILVAYALFGRLIRKALVRSSSQEFNDNQREELNAKIVKLEEAYRTDVLRINENAEIEKSEYKKAFDDAVREMSVKYATSDLLAGIVETMAKRFKAEIDSLNRAANVEKVSTAFRVNVYADKVTSNAGTVNFDQARYTALNNIIEICGLAKAIQSALYLEMTMNCPEDPSGTGAEYSVLDCYESFLLEYAAVNGNYVSTKDW